MAIELLDFYKRCLIPLTPHPGVTKLLHFVMAGGETTEDFAEVLERDSELQHWVRLSVQRMGKRATRLDQCITIVGQDRVRNLIIGRYIERAFIAEPETLLVKAQANKPKVEPKAPAKEEGEQEEAQKDDQKKAEAPKKEAQDKNKEEEESSEVIPELAGFSEYLQYAERSEGIAIAIRNSYPGQAFAGGVLFDYVKYFLKSRDLSALKDERLTNIDNYVDKIFEDGVRCGVAANSIMEKIVIKHQKTIFVTALLHNIGKALLLAYDPKTFEEAFLASTGAKKVEGAIRMDSADSEQAFFDFDHAQAGSLFFRRLSFFESIEKSIDFHHHPMLLKFSDTSLYALSCALRLSGRLVKLYEKYRGETTDTERLPDDAIKKSQDYVDLKLNDKDWSFIKADYAKKLDKAEL